MRFHEIFRRIGIRLTIITDEVPAIIRNNYRFFQIEVLIIFKTCLILH